MVLRVFEKTNDERDLDADKAVAGVALDHVVSIDRSPLGRGGDNFQLSPLR